MRDQCRCSPAEHVDDATCTADDLSCQPPASMRVRHRSVTPPAPVAARTGEAFTSRAILRFGTHPSVSPHDRAISAPVEPCSIVHRRARILPGGRGGRKLCDLPRAQRSRGVVVGLLRGSAPHPGPPPRSHDRLRVRVVVGNPVGCPPPERPRDGYQTAPRAARHPGGDPALHPGTPPGRADAGRSTGRHPRPRRIALARGR